MEDARAEEDFLNALKTMDPETPDRLITESYLLHYYISSGNKEKYEELAREYFGGKNSLKDQFNYLAREGARQQARFSLKFAAYVYIKALYKFYLENIPEKLINKLKDIDTSLSNLNKEAEKQINGHPWEIIYKYLALIMRRYNEGEVASAYEDKIKMFADQSEGIIQSIAKDSLRECGISTYQDENNFDSRFTYMYT